VGEVRSIVATYDQLQQLLEQSLRDLNADSSDLESTQERELSRALQRFTGRLNDILAESTDSAPSDELAIVLSSPPVSAPDSAPSSSDPIHLMTSCDGVILMANDAAVDVLGVDVRGIGTVSLAEWIPYEEWRWVHLRLKAVQPRQGSVSWVVNMNVSEGSVQTMVCSVTPMLDRSRNVTAWHWELRKHMDSAHSHPFSTFVQGFETALLNGQTLDSCLKKICEGFVQTFGYPYVWIATVQDGQPIQLRAQAATPDLDWDAHGQSWWASISRQEMLAQACVASEGSLASPDSPCTGEFAWFPPAFQLQEVYCLPLAGAGQGDFSGLLVVCSKMTKAFNSSIRGWLETLGREVEHVMARGMEMEQLRLHSAVIGSVHDAVCVTDPHGRVEWVNQAYTTLFGVTPRQVLGTPLRSFPHAQLQKSCPGLESTIKETTCVKTEVMEKGENGESFVLEQVLTPLVDAQGKTTHCVVILHDVTARTAAAMHMKHQAYHDPLTDLPNRIMFEDRLQLALAQARRSGTLLALFFLDLDNFKSINDQQGHQMGDRLLRVVAKRLVTCVRTTDTVSRLSGDEFTVILQGLDGIQDIRQVAQKIVDCLTPPIHLNGKNILVQTSIGIAVYPKDATDPRRLLAIADQAMYRAKDYGGQRWYFATPEWNME
jgi:diguanylate cyclase (GGDEF)-like protein/PAS domain S-box-containing protein